MLGEGFLVLDVGGDGDYYSLTPNGRTQIDAAPGFTPDAFIYGARAL